MERIKQIAQKLVCFINEMQKVAKNIFGTYENSSAKYTALSPVNDVKDCEEHINALEWAIHNPSIKNIAISGPFGSGKTSMINTFLERNPFLKQNSIRVSLATFGDSCKKTNLEEEFLKQLFYKVEFNKIPQSRYRKLHKIKTWPIYLTVVVCIITILLSMFIFYPDTYDGYLGLIVAAGAKYKLSDKISKKVFFALVLGIAYVVAKIIQQFACRISIKEIKLTSTASVKREEPVSESIFNRNMDEIVYFFEETDYSLVFIEDLDRFDDALIFVQLRELNTLLNNYDAIKRRIVFVYAIKDSMFNGEERTKFFDFLIPIIPVINSTNSEEIFMKMIRDSEEAGMKHEISEDYIVDISSNISDMRLLQNIYNEFVMYKETLKNQQGLSTLVDEMMMSLIIFKNLFPADFAKLQNEDGIVKDAFNNKEDFIVSETERLKEELNRKIKILENIENDILDDQREVKFAMLCALSGWKGMATRIREIYGVQYSASDILKDDFNLKELLKEKTWHVVSYGTAGQSLGEKQVDVVNICEPYVNRFEYLQYAGKEREEQLRKEISDLEMRIQEISELSMEDVLNIYTPANVLSNEVCSNKLLVFMLRRGYINERYEHYINYFKGNSITLGDLKFIHSIKYQTPLAFSYSLSKERMHQIIRKIKVSEFGERAALNFELMEYMLSTKEYDTKLEIYVGQLAMDNKDTWRFIDEFIDITQQQRRFIKILSSKWNGFWDDVYENNVLTYERKIEYLRQICFYCDLETIVNLNSNGNVRDFFLNDENILHYFPEKMVPRLIDLIKGLNLTFSKINIDSAPESVLDYIFDNGYYQINYDMIKCVVMHQDKSKLKLLKSQNYTVILNLGYNPLIEKVQKNLERYVDDIVLSEDNIEESSKALISLLSNLISDTERCDKIVEHQACIFDKLEEVCYDFIDDEQEFVQNLWSSLLEHEKINLCWENIYTYWKAFGLSDPLINYISKHQEALAYLDFKILDDEFKKEIIKSTIESNAFNRLARCFKMENFNIEIDDIATDRLNPMIQWHYFEFNSANYEKLNSIAPELCKDFILENQETFVNLMDDIILTELNFKKLIQSKKCNSTVKSKTIRKYGESLMTRDIAIELVHDNAWYGKSIFNAIWDNLIDEKQRERLLFKQLTKLGASDFAKCLPELGEPYCRLYRDVVRHDERISHTPRNLELAERLKQVGYLTSYEVEPPKFYGLMPISKIICRVKALPKK